MKKILGLDFHGVLDKNPELFIGMANKTREMGGEVHIITGESLHSTGIQIKLLNLNQGVKFWDELVSVQDALKETIERIGINIHGRDIYDDYDWDRYKGIYCRFHSVTLHIDDTLKYADYFETPFYYYGNGGGWLVQ